MNKGRQKADNVRKVFVRNSIRPAKSSVVVPGSKHVKFAGVEDDDLSTGEQTDFSLPEFCSILKLADEIKKVQLKPNSELVKRELEKLPKQYNLNFDRNEKIYQDLISVQRPVPELQPKVKSSHTSKFAMKKDPEPDLKELLKCTFQPEYSFARFTIPEVTKSPPEFNGRSIYKLTKRLTVCDTY